MITKPTSTSRWFGLRMVSPARALLAVSVLAALTVTTRSLAQTPTFNTLKQTWANLPFGFVQSAAVADFNGDTKLDTIVTDGGNTLRVMLGNGDGTFTEHNVNVPAMSGSNVVGFSTSDTSYLALHTPNADGFGLIKAVDVNGDGKPDLVCIAGLHIPQGGTPYWLAAVFINTGNDANGVPQFSATYYNTGCDRSITVGNLNADGAPDLIVGSAYGSLLALLNDGHGNFTAQSQYFQVMPSNGGPSAGPGVIVDVNGDGKGDFIESSGQAAATNIFLGNGNGTFQAPVVIQLPGIAPGAIASADLNNDGHPDFAEALSDGSVAVFLNNGNGTYGTPTKYQLPPTVNPSDLQHINTATSVALTDINGDGKLDLVASFGQGWYGSFGVAVYPGNGDGTFGSATTISMTDLPYEMSVNDFTGDGKPDIGMALYNARAYGVLTNTTPAPTVAAITPITTISAPVITVPANITTPATGAAGAAVTFTATATSKISSEIFRRSTTPGEAWQDFSVTFKPTISGNFKLRFQTISDNGADNSFFIDSVSLASGATQLFGSGFENPTATNGHDYPAWAWATTGALSSDVAFGDWTYTNYSGVLQSGDAGFGGTAAQAGSQYGFVQAYNGVYGNFTSATSVALVAGQTYTVKFSQAARSNFNSAPLTYAVTLESSENNVVTATPASSSTFPVGTTAVGLSATNSVGGTATGSFNVTVTKAPATITLSNLSQTYDGNAKTVTATTTPSGLNVVINYLGNNTNASASGCPVVATINDGVYYGTVTGTLVIAKAPSTTVVTISGAPFTYNGSAQTPATVAVTGAGGLSLSPTASYANNTNAGTATASYAYAGDNNHTGSSDSKTFTINKAAATVKVTSYTVTFDGKLHTATATVSGVPGETGAIGTVDLSHTTHTDVGIYSTDTWSFTGSTNYNNISSTAITDTITGTATASLVAVRGGGDDESTQSFTVVFSATDAVGVKTLTATLNGITVTNGQVVKLQLIKSGKQESEKDDGKLMIKATSFTLTVVATYTNGGTATATTVPLFVKNGQDSEDKSSGGSGSDDKGTNSGSTTPPPLGGPSGNNSGGGHG